MFQNKCGGAMRIFFGMDLFIMWLIQKLGLILIQNGLNLHQRKHLKPPKIIIKSIIYLQLILLVMWGHHILIFLLV
jgi:hypothetical protein